jgi:hypothetical protein
VKNANGADEEELVFESAQDKAVEDWGRDGRFLLIYTTERRGDEWLLPAPGAAGERRLTPLLNSQFIEISGQLSPDGKYVLYASDESGRLDVYVRALPPAKGKWPISTGGGESPRWSPSGREIFYLASQDMTIGASQKMMAVEVKGGTSGLEVGTPKLLFEARLARTYSGRNRYDVTDDGKRFLMFVPVEETPGSPMTVVVNWTAALKQ